MGICTVSFPCQPKPQANSYQCYHILIASTESEAGQRWASCSQNCSLFFLGTWLDYTSWHPWYWAVTMRLSSHQWDVTGSDVGPSKPSPDNTPLDNPPALALCSSFLKINPETLEATWEMAEPQDQRRLWPWSLLGRKAHYSSSYLCSTLYMLPSCMSHFTFLDVFVTTAGAWSTWKSRGVCKIMEYW